MTDQPSVSEYDRRLDVVQSIFRAAGCNTIQIARLTHHEGTVNGPVGPYLRASMALQVHPSDTVVAKAWGDCRKLLMAELVKLQPALNADCSVNSLILAIDRACLKPLPEEQPLAITDLNGVRPVKT